MLTDGHEGANPRRSTAFIEKGVVLRFFYFIALRERTLETGEPRMTWLARAVVVARVGRASKIGVKTL